MITISLKRFLNVLAAAVLALVLMLGMASCGSGKPAAVSPDSTESAPAPTEAPPQQQVAGYDDYIGALELDYAYNLAVKITEDDAYNNSVFGDRQAGSEAEHATAELLAQEMQNIGLTDVEKVPVSVNSWQFNGASIKLDGDAEEILLHSYATAATSEGGIDAEIVYVGKGTAADYEGKDVAGKIVLFDVNQREDWWVTYPMLEAEHQGAVAALACSNAGFSEISDEAYNANDICGPTSIPTVSITVKDSKYIQDKLAAGPVTAHLVVDNVVEEGGTTYDVIGRIKGVRSDEMIMYGAHYDAHFKGFQDDTIAATGVLTIAKAMIKSGYTPERDILFVLHGAEEWGASDTQYDWCIGSWELINKAHPEWAGKILAFFNFELPAYEFADYTYTTSVPEFYTLVKDFAAAPYSPMPEGVFKDGIKTEGYQTYTYSDDFSYYAAGVPSVINGFLLTEDGEDVFPFYYQYYHTNFDTKEIYNEAVLKFNLSYYGAMGIHIDRTPALELDYTNQYERLKAAIDEKLAKANGADYDGYMAAVEKYGEAAKAARDKMLDINARYQKAVAGSASEEETSAIWNEAAAFNASNLKLFKQTQDALLGLIYESPIVPHESPQKNIDSIVQTLAYLEAGNVISAVDETAWAINGVNEWYCMYFSKEVTDQFYDMFYAEWNKENQFWGSGRQFVWANVDEATRSITAKYDKENPDLSAEIAIYGKALDDQAAVYRALVAQEVTDIGKLTEALNSL